MYVVAVNFDVEPQHIEAFKREMLINARNSVELEPGCRQFDVTVSVDDPAHIFLYEIYDDEAAFQEHLASAHFKTVDTTIAPWVCEKKIRIFNLVR